MNKRIRSLIAEVLMLHWFNDVKNYLKENRFSPSITLPPT